MAEIHKRIGLRIRSFRLDLKLKYLKLKRKFLKPQERRRIYMKQLTPPGAETQIIYIQHSSRGCEDLKKILKAIPVRYEIMGRTILIAYVKKDYFEGVWKLLVPVVNT